MFHYIPRLTIEAHGLRKRIANIHHRRVDAAHASRVASLMMTNSLIVS